MKCGPLALSARSTAPDSASSLRTVAVLAMPAPWAIFSRSVLRVVNVEPMRAYEPLSMTIATKFGGFTSATVIRLLVSTIKLPSESSAMTLRLGKAAVSPRAKGIQSPMLQPKKFAPSRLRSDQKAVFDERLVTVSICSSTIGAKSFRQSKRFIANLRVDICRRVHHHEGDKFSAACKFPNTHRGAVQSRHPRMF